MLQLGASIRFVSMRFSFSNSKIIPSSLKFKAPATVEREEVRRERHSGVLVIEPTESCCLAGFPQQLVLTGYPLVDGFYQPRPDPKDIFGGRMYGMVHFLFYRREFAEISPAFQAIADTVFGDLTKMCDDAFWRVRAFSNPFYKDGREVVGQSTISINLEARIPRFHPDGSLLMQWQKDDQGNRVGDCPKAIVPAHYLKCH